MSIVGAVFARSRGDIRAKIASLATPAEVVTDSDDCIVIATGAPTVTAVPIRGTVVSPSSASSVTPSKPGFAVIDGSPFTYDGATYAYPSRDDLERILNATAAKLQGSLLGQYALVRSTDSGIELMTDPNSLRSFFVYREADFVLFASRLQGITGIIRGLQVAWSEFGSHWLAHNQLSELFFVRNVHRLTGGRLMRLRAEAGSIRFEEEVVARKTVSSKEAVRIDPFNAIETFLATHDGPIRLALSGGVDSRLLLALAVRAQPANFGVFVYESPGRADSDLAKQLARAIGVSCETVPPATARTLIDDGTLDQFAAESFCLAPLSASLQLTHYAAMYKTAPGIVLLDGGFGEVGRGQFYRHVELLRRFSRVHRFAQQTYADALSLDRADVFNADARRSMEEGFAWDVADFVRQLHQSDDDRPEDWAGVRYRRANFFGFAQSWIDQYGINHMPFGQDPFVHGILSRPISNRRGGKGYRDKIRSASPELAAIPLAKGTVRYPFGLSGNLVPLYSRLSRFQKASTVLPALWVSEREFVSDIVQSLETRTFSGYDIRKVDALVADVFSGRADRHAALDWFLSFELWRRAHALS